MSVTHGADVIRFFHSSHPRSSVCGGCATDCAAVGLPSLAYTFEPCDCGHALYVHLVERLWHKGCLVRREVANGGDGRG